jgi:hypothetical protein
MMIVASNEYITNEGVAVCEKNIVINTNANLPISNSNVNTQMKRTTKRMDKKIMLTIAFSSLPIYRICYEPI